MKYQTDVQSAQLQIRQQLAVEAEVRAFEAELAAEQSALIAQAARALADRRRRRSALSDEVVRQIRRELIRTRLAAVETDHARLAVIAADAAADGVPLGEPEGSQWRVADAALRVYRRAIRGGPRTETGDASRTASARRSAASRDRRV